MLGSSSERGFNIEACILLVDFLRTKLLSYSIVMLLLREKCKILLVNI